MITGKNAETARIIRQRVMHAVFRTEIRDGIPRVRRAINCLRRLRHIPIEFRCKLADLPDVVCIARLLPEPQLANVFKEQSRVLLLLDPEVRIKLTKQSGSFRMPGPKKVLRDTVELADR